MALHGRRTAGEQRAPDIFIPEVPPGPAPSPQPRVPIPLNASPSAQAAAGAVAPPQGGVLPATPQLTPEQEQIIQIALSDPAVLQGIALGLQQQAGLASGASDLLGV